MLLITNSKFVRVQNSELNYDLVGELAATTHLFNDLAFREFIAVCVVSIYYRSGAISIFFSRQQHAGSSHRRTHCIVWSLKLFEQIYNTWICKLTGPSTFPIAFYKHTIHVHMLPLQIIHTRKMLSGDFFTLAHFRTMRKITYIWPKLKT